MDRGTEGLPETAPLEVEVRADRMAAIDVGSNSIRLVVAQVLDDGYRLLDDEKVITRLGRGLAQTGRLDAESVEASVMAIKRLKAIAEGYGVSRLRAVATSAVREAVNSEGFIAALRQHTGIELEVISAEEEARLAFRSVLGNFDIADQTVGIADIGGGSTEIVVCTNAVIEQVHTLKLGAVRLTERFAIADDTSEATYKSLRAYVRETLKNEVPRPAASPAVLFGTGGTFTTLATTSMAASGAEAPAGEMLPYSVRGHELHRHDVRHMLDRLRDMPRSERARVPGLSPDRADIIVAGITIAERLMKRLGVNRLRVHDGGIRDGLMLRMIDDLRSGEAPAKPPETGKLRSAVWFGEKCQWERPHAEQVARLALAIFDRLEGAIGSYRVGMFTPLNRELLHAAALLHDVGYIINYAKHHKHSYHLIVHSGMRGFSQRELEIVANVARYHRRSTPKLKHNAFAKLARADRDAVCALGAILRVADGLDRTHTQRVRNVEVEVRSRKARFAVNAQSEPSVDLWGAQRKADLFADFFDLEPEFVWADAQQELTP